MTAYQILLRLPDDLRESLIAQYGDAGKGAGKHFTAVSRIAQIAREVADYDHLDSRGLAFEFSEDEHTVAGGNAVIGIYRARRSTPAST